jgi:hypothetical protein
VRIQAQVILNHNIRDVRSRHELLQIADAYGRIAQNTRHRFFEQRDQVLKLGADATRRHQRQRRAPRCCASRIPARAPSAATTPPMFR